jgi:charged multivesicular body protein 6
MGIGASKNKITSQDKAILDLKVQRDKLKRYQKNVRNYNQVCNYERETQ